MSYRMRVRQLIPESLVQKLEEAQVDHGFLENHHLICPSHGRVNSALLMNTL